MFNLKKQNATLASVNPRAELHGDEHVLAVDLKFGTTMGNDVLIEFHPDLKEALFRIGNASGQEEMELEEKRLTGLRFPQIGTLKWDHECAGYGLVVHDGLDGSNDISLTAIKVDQFSLRPKEGGSVDLSFRVIVKPTEEQIGRLCKRIQEGVEVSLTPPAAEDNPQQSLDTEQHQDAEAEADA